MFPRAVKPLHWGAINPFTGKLFTFNDPNLRWGDPSYYLEPGDPGFVPYGPAPAPPAKKKPFRRKAAFRPDHAPEPEYQPNTMPTYQYHIAPNPNGGFTTRPVLGTLVTTDFFINRLVQQTGLTTAQCEAVFDAVFDTICACVAGCDHATDIRGRLRFRPTSGGSSPDPAGFQNAAEINADIAISLTSEKRDDWRAGLTLQSMGEVGKLSPVIDSILSQENGQTDVYVPGTLIVLNGDNLRFDKADPLQGVFIRSGNNPEVRLTVYGTTTPSSLSVLMPAALTGAQTVRMAAYINGSIRSFTYMTPLAQVT
mgnify:CR=1 FL=1